MEYKKLTDEDLKKLKPGDKANFGNGRIVEIVSIEESKKVDGVKRWTPNGLEDIFESELTYIDSDGKQKTAYTSSLKNATIESMDKTIERCGYCGKLRPSEEMKYATIRRNYQWQDGRYCADGPCANYAQMASEG